MDKRLDRNENAGKVIDELLGLNRSKPERGNRVRDTVGLVGQVLYLIVAIVLFLAFWGFVLRLIL